MIHRQTPGDASCIHEKSSGGEPLGSFRELNADLFRLPKDVLCSAEDIAQRIANLEQSPLSLAEKLRLIEAENLTPFITGSRLSGDFRLHIHLSDSLDKLTISRIDGKISEEELNGVLRIPKEWLTPLVTAHNPNLIFSARDILSNAPSQLEAEQAVQLFTTGRRITEFMGVPVSWDQAVDRNVWTTNIDTVHFLSALSQDGVFKRDDITSSMEVGVGGGAISKTLLTRLAQIREHVATDISPHALICAKRNISPILLPGQRLSLFLGKGIRSISASVDLLLVNPPYIPHLSRPDSVDPYRGTGLIKEVIELGVSKLNRANPLACIYLGMSSLAERDLNEYLAARPDLKVEPVGTRRLVPLKILAVNENKEWLEFLTRKHGLIDAATHSHIPGFRFWHEIFVVKITPKSSAD